MIGKRVFILMLSLVFLASCDLTIWKTTTPSPITPTPSGPTPTPDPVVNQQRFKQQLQSFPPAYRNLNFPDPLLKVVSNQSIIIPLPSGDQKQAIIQNFSSTAEKNRLSILNLNLDSIAVFPSPQDYTFSAVPVAHPETPTTLADGVLLGLIYDKTGHYPPHQPGAVYQVRLFEQNITFSNSSGEVVFTQPIDNKGGFIGVQDPPVEEGLVVFIKNGCYICWFGDGRDGCLICD